MNATRATDDVVLPAVHARAANADPHEASLLGLAAALLRHFWLMVVVGGAVVALSLLIAFFSPDRYAATSTFLPETGQSGAMPRYASIAAQLGIQLPTGGSGGESVAFYAQLLTSRDVLREAVQSSYRVGGGEVTFFDAYGIKGDSPADALYSALRQIPNDLQVRVDLNSGLVSLTTIGPTPAMAEALNRRLLDLVNQFNVEQRQSQVAAERRFVQGRLDHAQQALAASERELQQFLEANRLYQNSPQLVFQAEHLQRQVQLHQDVVTSLSQSLEQASIEEVRNTPVLTVVETPEGSAVPAGRGLKMALLVGFFVGCVIAVGLALTVDYVQRQREARPELYDEVRRAGREALGRLTPRRAGAARED